MDFLGWLLSALLILYVYNTNIAKFDETDQLNNRSGLTLYTDHGTGCQYIKAGIFGELDPRLDNQGNHVCKNLED